MEEPTEAQPPVEPYRTNFGREIEPFKVYDFTPGSDWRTPVFIVVMVLLVEAFTLGIVLITWWVINP